MLNHEIHQHCKKIHTSWKKKSEKKVNIIPALRPLSRMEFLRILGMIKIKWHW